MARQRLVDAQPDLYARVRVWRDGKPLLGGAELWTECACWPILNVWSDGKLREVHKVLDEWEPVEGAPVLSESEQLILALLGEMSWSYGLELVAASGGALERGSIFPQLYRLKAAGLVQSKPEPAEVTVLFKRYLYALASAERGDC